MLEMSKFRLNKWQTPKGKEEKMPNYDFAVSNMNCNGCVSNIKQALEKANKIETFDVQLETKHVSVSSELDEQTVAQIIIDAGYDAVPAQKKRGLFSRFQKNN